MQRQRRAVGAGDAFSGREGGRLVRPLAGSEHRFPKGLDDPTDGFVALGQGGGEGSVLTHREGAGELPRFGEEARGVQVIPGLELGQLAAGLRSDLAEHPVAQAVAHPEGAGIQRVEPIQPLGQLRVAEFDLGSAPQLDVDYDSGSADGDGRGRSVRADAPPQQDRQPQLGGEDAAQEHEAGLRADQPAALQPASDQALSPGGRGAASLVDVEHLDPRRRGGNALGQVGFEEGVCGDGSAGAARSKQQRPRLFRCRRGGVEEDVGRQLDTHDRREAGAGAGAGREGRHRSAPECERCIDVTIGAGWRLARDTGCLDPSRQGDLRKKRQRNQVTDPRPDESTPRASRASARVRAQGFTRCERPSLSRSSEALVPLGWIPRG